MSYYSKLKQNIYLYHNISYNCSQSSCTILPFEEVKLIKQTAVIMYYNFKIMYINC